MYRVQFVLNSEIMKETVEAATGSKVAKVQKVLVVKTLSLLPHPNSATILGMPEKLECAPAFCVVI